MNKRNVSCIALIAALSGCSSTHPERGAAIGAVDGALIGSALASGEEPERVRFAGAGLPKGLIKEPSVSILPLANFEATVSIKTEPSGAEIWYKGSKTDYKTNISLSISESCFWSCANREITLKKNGYFDEVYIIYNADTTEINASLKSKSIKTTRPLVKNTPAAAAPPVSRP